jgi:hypothetical protein
MSTHRPRTTIVKTLLRLNADINGLITMYKGLNRSPGCSLKWQTCNWLSVFWRLEQKLILNSSYYEGTAALCVAAKEGHLRIVIRFFDQRAVPLTAARNKYWAYLKFRILKYV